MKKSLVSLTLTLNMKELPPNVPTSPSLAEEIRRGWYWVVFSWQTLSRVGGPGAWLRTFKRLAGLLGDRTGPPQGNAWQNNSTGPISFFDSARFPFTQSLEANWETIYQELSALRGEHFIDWSERHLYKEGWTTFGLYGFGIKIEKNCDLCPETTRLLEQIPNLVTAGFSSLQGGASIAPHTGYPEGVLRCHLGLVIPPDRQCGIRVGAEVRHWEVGKCLVFDDSLEHEAWNRSGETRVILLLDFRPQF
jgi:ornithine lipid ester-linked acyl 2-hydroxylase